MATTTPLTPPDQHREPPPLLGGACSWALCAAAALGLAVCSSLGPHRVWGATAALGYLAAALLAARGRSPRTAGAVAVAGAVLLPLLWLLAVDRAQLEVRVVARSAGLLLTEGTPYLQHPVVPEDFNPYLPGMAVFGLPEAVAGPGPLTDPRLWMGAAFLGALTLALPAESRRAPLRWIAACPLVALPLAVGGVDLPVAALMCLGLALAGRGRAGAAGAALGVAAALKWTAWPAIPVVLALLAVSSRSAGHSADRAAARCGLVALLTAAALVLPAALRDPGAFRAHVVDFPLGLTDAVSSAASPLPGHLLATHVPGGRTLALLLLGVSALLLALSLLLRPPATAADAAARLALGLLLAIAFMPASRFGYLVHPLVLAVWAAVRETPGRPLLLRVRKQVSR
ncbi:glycosyltransferase 87 family protein [Streptomyces sp. ms184]|uniref:glycosyltransferase 87 family protein n=1 Tax=Streptomyces sp. ms184 TaxID=1827974 RepID=UPI000BF1B64F|nr:glycosyltransferase 87 family protein [Streptomyces sp. ms184]